MKRRLLWIMELFVWFLILVVVSSSIMFARYAYRKNFNVYQIFLPDVDGLIVGSPVKILGIQVGYVNQIDIVGEDVYVKFLINKKDIKLPRGTIATVEFSGLGGSKSLELYPPQEENLIGANKLIVVQQPKRIHDSLGLLMRMFDDIAGIAYDTSSFMEQVGIIKRQNGLTTSKQPDFNTIINQSNDWLDSVNSKCTMFSNKLKKNGKKYDAKEN